MIKFYRNLEFETGSSIFGSSAEEIENELNEKPRQEAPGGDEEGQHGNSHEPSGASGGKKGLFDDLGTSEDLDGYLDQTASTEKQKYNTEKSESPDPGTTKPEGSASDFKVSAKSEAAAKMVVHTIDFGFAEIGDFVTEYRAPGKYGAKGKQKEDLIEAWALYIESVGMDIPPWLGVLLLSLIVYGGQTAQIVKDYNKQKKVKKEVEKAVAERKRKEESQDQLQEKPENQESQRTAEHTDTNGTKTKITVEEVITDCLYCGGPLKPHQIKAGGKFCCKSHSTKFYNESRKTQ